MPTFSLNAVFAALRLDTQAVAVQIVPAARLAPPQPFAPLLPFAVTQPLLVCGLADAPTLARAQATLLTAYPPDHEAKLIAGSAVSTVSVGTIAQHRPAPDLCIYLPPLDILDAASTFDALRYITARLRAPGGCPWDREQTHESLKPYLLQETYEVLDALDSGDLIKLREELGDLLMQVMIHAQVAAEAGTFDIGDVIAGIASKLVRRHPHVFADVRVSGAREVLRNWEQIKQAEREGNGEDGAGQSLLAGVPAHLPALACAQDMQERAARAGFDWPSIEGALSDVARQAADLPQAQTHGEKLDRLGDLLFSLVGVARRLEVDAEEALRLTNRRYRQRFTAMEALCRQRGLALNGLPYEEQKRLWEEAKAASSED